MSNNKILIADDEPKLRKLVGDFLRREGFTVAEADNGREAIEIFTEDKELSLIILDVMMPEYDGWAVCREIRKSSEVPIIMLTARSEESDELFGFELGADEYVSKPFSPQVLIARVQALLRRTKNSNNGYKEYKGLNIDFTGHAVYIDKQKVELSPKEYELLAYMAENEGVALSREKILTAVWNYDYYGDARTVDTHIKRLRAKIGTKGDYIQTIRGLGYKFDVE